MHTWRVPNTLDGKYSAELQYASDLPFKIESDKIDLLIACPKPLVLKMPAKLATTLKQQEDYVPEQAFDKDGAGTYFWSGTGVKPGDSFTLTLDTPASVKSIKVTTGCLEHPDDILHGGFLEISEDGNSFTKVAEFKDGIAEATVKRKIKAARITCTQEQNFWLVVTDIEIQ